MSIEMGHSIGYAYKTEDGLNGFTEEHLVYARRMLNNDIPEAEDMDIALGRVIDAPEEHSRDIVKEMGEDGQTLLAASNGFGATFPEGLMYVEGDKADERAFSAVHMGLWIMAAKVEIPGGGKMWEPSRERIREALVGMGFTDVDKSEDDMVWGIPVTRTTRIEPIHPQEGDIQQPFTFGHRLDLQAIENLAISDELKGEVVELVEGYHDRELK